jgi:hypothetical protein
MIEHQSRPVMPLRVLEYTVLVWQEHRRQQALAIAQHLWTYLLYHSELQSPEIDQIVTSAIPDEGKEQFMSTAEMLMQKGRQEGVIVARQKAVLDALEIRFGHVAPGLRETIEAIHDETRLRSLHQTAIQAVSLEDFVRVL